MTTSYPGGWAFGDDPDDLPPLTPAESRLLAAAVCRALDELFAEWQAEQAQAAQGAAAA